MGEQVVMEYGQNTRVIDIGVFSPILGRELILAVRNARHLHLKPVLALSRPDFERLLDYWPQFYLTGPVIGPLARESIWSKLRQLLVRKKRVLSPPRIQFADEALSKIRGQMMGMRAIPVDGIWVSVNITGDDNG